MNIDQDTSSWTKEERSLLLMLECMTVDNSGGIRGNSVNAEDIAIMKRWTEAGFIESGRVASEDLTETRSLWVRLSESARACAHRLRCERADRQWSRRTWRTTEEKKADNRRELQEA